MEYTYTTLSLHDQYFQNQRFEISQPIQAPQNALASGGIITPLPSATIDISGPSIQFAASNSDLTAFLKKYWPHLLIGGILLAGGIGIAYYIAQKNQKETSKNTWHVVGPKPESGATNPKNY